MSHVSFFKKVFFVGLFSGFGVAMADDFCEHKSDGYYANPQVCGEYIVCFADGTGEISLECPEGLSWNTAGGYCDWAENVTCESTEQEKENNHQPIVKRFVQKVGDWVWANND